MLDLTPRREDLDPIETATREDIAALQLVRLKETVKRVYDNVAHYRKAFDAAGVLPQDLASLADLAKLPFTTKADLRASYPFGMFATPRIGSCASTPPPARQASPPSSATPGATSRHGARWLPARCAPRVRAPA